LGLLYEILLREPEFLRRLRKYLEKRGAKRRAYFYFLNMLKHVDMNDVEAVKSALQWLRQNGLIEHISFEDFVKSPKQKR